jgi:hypothetical protein
MGFSVISDALAKMGNVRTPSAANKKPRRTGSASLPDRFTTGDMPDLEYAIAPRRQAFMQLKQTTHRVASMFPFFESIHDDLHDFSQSPQRVQFSGLILTRKREKREMTPSAVPTGQMALHHVLPPLSAR